MVDKALAVLKAGGFTLSFIILLSIVALAIAVERSAALWRFLERARRLAETVKRCLYRGALAEARTACERSASPVADLFLVGFERFGRSSNHALEAAVERERQRVALALKGPTWMLGTIGAIAPFVGLFGTVVGIMRAFTEIGLKHAAGIDVVGPGISEALITTAFGIVVGIEAVMIYNYFQAKMLRTALELKLLAEEFVELLGERSTEEGRAWTDKDKTRPAKDAKSSAADAGELSSAQGQAQTVS
jgi:biopolymer transport protein ExbB